MHRRRYPVLPSEETPGAAAGMKDLVSPQAGQAVKRPPGSGRLHETHERDGPAFATKGRANWTPSGDEPLRGDI